ncbi:MAG TPA: tagatose 1,6-diphosphate aldolase, partial [Candidatus Limnocylindria bacterium]
MTRGKVTKGKAKGIDACADDRGVIRAAAMDQRGSLKKEIGKQGGQPTDHSLTEFKTAVTKVLTQHATAILMDPEYGLPALRARRPGSGVLLAYEKTGYDADPQNRTPDLLERW